MPLIHLTRPDGSVIELNPDTISSVKPALPNMYVSGVRSIVRDDGENFAVKESIVEINAILKAIGR